MKDKSKVILIIAILLITALIVYVCYGIFNGNKNPVATMEVSYIDNEGNEKIGTVKIELNPDVAPISVANFTQLANNGFYDGLTFHRIISDFMIQGGDKAGNGSGSASFSNLMESYTITKIENNKAICKKNITKDEQKEISISELPEGIKEGTVIWYKDGKYQVDIEDYTYSIKGEFAANGVNNNLKFGKGIIGMARSDYSTYGLSEEGYNSASSQFFIVTTDDKDTINSLNQYYASFGKVIEGYDVVEAIANVKVKEAEAEGEESSTPETAPIIKSIRVETYGANYGIPKTINFDKILSTVREYQEYYEKLFSSSSTSDVTAETESNEATSEE
ncbi:MAG: peptidylprolyl isomerase [Clostridia bacterium]|nr:peptidylprolyl isomerase [Clostridia bacterium]